MKLFVGLGNPGTGYAKNRHNIGFMALDQIASDHGFGPWKSKFQGDVTEGRLGTAKVLLLKPGTFMNRSGQSVQAAMQFYKCVPADVVVFHDELDLAPGKCRVKQGGGHAGHNGLRSIHAHIGAEYGRVRLGIGHPGHKDKVAGYVLHDFPKSDAEWLDALLRGISEGAEPLAQDDTAKFMNAVALRVAPPRSSTGPGPAKAKKASALASPAPDTAPPDTAPPDTAASAPHSEGAVDPDARSPLQKLVDRFR